MSQLSNIDALEAQALGLLDTIRILKQAAAAEVASEAPIVITAPAPRPTPAQAVEAAFADYGKFYDFLRGNSMLGPKISAAEFSGCDAILQACVAYE